MLLVHDEQPESEGKSSKIALGKGGRRWGYTPKCISGTQEIDALYR